MEQSLAIVHHSLRESAGLIVQKSVRLRRNASNADDTWAPLMQPAPCGATHDKLTSNAHTFAFGLRVHSGCAVLPRSGTFVCHRQATVQMFWKARCSLTSARCLSDRHDHPKCFTFTFFYLWCSPRLRSDRRRRLHRACGRASSGRSSTAARLPTSGRGNAESKTG